MRKSHERVRLKHPLQDFAAFSKATNITIQPDD
jgi:hypothetical protein